MEQYLRELEDNSVSYPMMLCSFEGQADVVAVSRDIFVAEVVMLLGRAIGEHGPEKVKEELRSIPPNDYRSRLAIIKMCKRLENLEDRIFRSLPVSIAIVDLNQADIWTLPRLERVLHL